MSFILCTREDAIEWFGELNTPNHAAEVLAFAQSRLFGLDVLEDSIRASGYPGELLEPLELVEYRGSGKLNEFGHDIFATVGYNRYGNLTSWGGHRELGDEAGMYSWTWRCYAD